MVQGRIKNSALLGLLLLLTISFTSCASDTSSTNTNPPASTAQFVVKSLVSDTAEYNAATLDPLLVNPWGLAIGPTGNPWIVNEGTGTSTVYDSNGVKAALVVNLPGLNGNAGTAIATVFNPTSEFMVNGAKSLFIFASPQGTISAWNQSTATSADIKVSRDNVGAAYTGLAIGNWSGAGRLYAADFHNGVIDMFDGNFSYLRSFRDSTMPANFYPFNVQAIGTSLYVTYAKRNDVNDREEVEGAGLGYVDEFGMDGTFIRRFASQGTLNAPWGVAMTPSNWGDRSNMLLIGNFGDGKINVYDPVSGTYAGQLMGTDGKEIELEGLWALQFGPVGSKTNTLYFTQGADDEAHGVFGTITLK